MSRGLQVLVAALVAVVALTAAPSRVQTAPIIGQLRVVLIVDSSSAMSAMTNPFRSALQSFLEALPGTPETLEPEVTLISTGGQLRVRVPVTTDRQKLKKAAGEFASDGGGNAFLDTMLEADKRFLKNMERRPVFVVMMNDNSAYRGEPRIDEYNTFWRDFLKRGGRAHAVVIRGMNSGVHTDILMHITSASGGYYDALAVPSALPDQMKYVGAMVAADTP